MVHTKSPFQEVLALFWHEHFAASSEVLSSESRHWMVNHVNLWRKQGTGNLRDLLVDMARDWLMLKWLNGDTSTARHRDLLHQDGHHLAELHQRPAGRFRER